MLSKNTDHPTGGAPEWAPHPDTIRAERLAAWMLEIETLATLALREWDTPPVIPGTPVYPRQVRPMIELIQTIAAKARQ